MASSLARILVTGPRGPAGAMGEYREFLVRLNPDGTYEVIAGNGEKEMTSRLSGIVPALYLGPMVKTCYSQLGHPQSTNRYELMIGGSNFTNGIKMTVAHIGSSYRFLINGQLRVSNETGLFPISQIMLLEQQSHTR